MISTPLDFYKVLKSKFPFTPTSIQDSLLHKLSAYIFDKDRNTIFLLKGYAGTGKTTTMSTLVNNMWQVGMKSVLLAPTGRAAKVISNYSKKKAFTIHKKIYHPKKASNGGVAFTLQQNKHTNTIFIIDEASMIPDNAGNVKFSDQASLLDDLISYVYSGKNCKIIFVGDTAQLPPVKLELSPALKAETLEINYNKSVIEIELNEVMRQHQDSGILENATNIRGLLSHGDFENFTFNLNFPDIIRLTDGYDIQDAITVAYDSSGVEDTAFIVRSNKRANQYNEQIRSAIRGQENEIATGDFIMVVKNNYFWLEDNAEAGFIANGDICEILRISDYKDLYGFRFAGVTVRMIDYPDQQPFETVVLLDTLSSESPSLTYDEYNTLYQEVSKDYVDEKSAYKRLLAVKSNIYFNALQIKFSYAMTCHKSQGGQWKTVFLEQPYLPEGPSLAYYRWLYTAITRAQEKLYLIGFKDECFEE
ncbi:AAA family ATPase [Aureibaculum sp. A20]|uniref:AAA family ATPase n=1 Tax=Aureibaculum flavum TaxID=2795986 RepID=A0ABS0WRV2_9FLAO|nr:AAA family ATPase [Aureibaculum flavum]MBJ2174603.1 AAA family ATPase [Aureibaculum flavum]